MGTTRHKGTATVWGKTIPAKNSTRYGIVRLPRWTGPTQIPEHGADCRLPDVPSQLTARELVNEGLVECVFWGCGPYNHVRGGEKRHATFVHGEGKSLSRHSKHPETTDHLQSKAALLAWIRSTYPDDVVDFDLDTKNIAVLAEGGVSKGQRPDAWIELASGAEIAIEFQHSAGDFDRVREKTRRYEQQGITVWWVFSGRSPATCVNVKHAKYRHKYGDLTADLSPSQLTLAGEGTQFLWFDVERRRMATPMVPTKRPFRAFSEEHWSHGERVTTRAYWGPPRKGYSKWARMYEHQLAQCSVDLASGQLVTPGTQVWKRESGRADNEIAALRQEAHQRFLDSCTERENVVLSLPSKLTDEDSLTGTSPTTVVTQHEDLPTAVAPSDSATLRSAEPTVPSPDVNDPVVMDLDRTAGGSRAQRVGRETDVADSAESPRAASGESSPPSPPEVRSWFRRGWQWLRS